MTAALVAAALEQIDAANQADPSSHDGQPLALVQGQRASVWLPRLADAASPALVIAVRAHHLRRWELARADYPEGRAGYLRWRRDNKRHQATAARQIVDAVGLGSEVGERVEELLAMRAHRQDADAQVLEDAACLVFLETAFDPMVDRLDHDHLVAVVAKTLRKMSPRAIELAGEVSLSEPARAVLAEAVEAPAA